MKILVAEDNADSRVYLERILRSSGYEAESAENGRVAWDKARCSPPDLVVSDILMPEVDGFALCRQWKNDELLREIPFIFYTATYTDSQDEALALSLGADRFVVKPQPPEVMLRIIREVLDAAGDKAAGAALPRDEFFAQYNSALFRKLEQKVRALEQEVAKRAIMEAAILRDAEIARQLQEALLTPLPDNPFVEAASIYQPGLYVGGDLYYLDWRQDGKLLRGFLFAAMGQGMSRALYAAAVHVMLREISDSDLPLAEQVRVLNRRVRQTFGLGMVTRGLAFELDLETRQLRWVNAGINKFWLAGGVNAGLVEHADVSAKNYPENVLATQFLPIAAGDAFYFCTTRAAALLSVQPDPPLAEFPAMVERLRAASATAEGEAQDVLAVCLRVRCLPERREQQGCWPRIFRFGNYADYQRFRGEIANILADATGLAHSFPEVAVNEALANALECRDGVARPHQVRLRVNAVGQRLIVRVKSTRMGFAGNAVLQRLKAHPEDMFAFGGSEAMGRGIPLMLSLSDKMVYNSEGTEVLLAWRLGEAAGEH